MLRPFPESQNISSRHISMPLQQLGFAIVLCLAAALFSLPAMAGDLRIPIPTRSKPTPVQQLNREGVKAVEKRQYDKAKKLFYRAYLLDPDDPFTLNNLGRGMLIAPNATTIWPENTLPPRKWINQICASLKDNPSPKPCMV